MKDLDDKFVILTFLIKLENKMEINQAIKRILNPAYDPCEEFGKACKTMRYDPQNGHVPRGFAGATGDLSEVELVLVFAEPGDPKLDEKHSGLSSAYSYAYLGYCNGDDQFYVNVRKILNLCWPKLSFDEQMKKVWLTDSVLCSARKECGAVPKLSSLACGKRFLSTQLELFHDALIVAVGYKAKTRLRSIGVKDFLYVYAAAPPGCNRIPAYPSWQQIPEALRQRHGGCHSPRSVTSAKPL